MSSSKRHSIFLYDDTDPTKVFSISNSAGIVTLNPGAEELTVSGESLFLGTDTYVQRQSVSEPSTLIIQSDGSEVIPAGFSVMTYAEALTRQAELAAIVTADQGPWGIAAIEYPYAVRGSGYGGDIVDESANGLSPHGNWANFIAIVLLSDPGSTTITTPSIETLFDDKDSEVATNSANIVSEISRAILAENSLDSKIDSSVATLQSTDTTNLNNVLANLSTNSTNRQLDESVLQANIDNEVTRATNAENASQAVLDALVITESDNETIQNNALASEVSRATAAETALQGDVDNNEGTIEAAIDALETIHGSSSSDKTLFLNGGIHSDGSYENMWIRNRSNVYGSPYANELEPGYMTFSLADQGGVSLFDSISLSVDAYDIDETVNVYLSNTDPTDLSSGVKSFMGTLSGSNGVSSTSTFNLNPLHILNHIISGGVNLYVIFAMDSTDGSFASPRGIKIEDINISFPNNISSQVTNIDAEVAAQSTAAQAVEASLQSQINNILNNVDPASIDSFSEIVSHYNTSDNTHSNLLHLLLTKVMEVENVMNTLTDPDIQPLNATLQAFYDSLIPLSAAPTIEESLSVSFESSEGFVLGEPISDSDAGVIRGGWSGGAQPYFQNDSTHDEVITDSYANEGSFSWYLGSLPLYNNPGQGSPFSPALPIQSTVADSSELYSALAGKTIRVKFSVRLDADFITSGSSLKVYAGNYAGNDRTGFNLNINGPDSGGVGARAFSYSFGGGSFPTTDFDGIPLETWTEITIDTTFHGSDSSQDIYSYKIGASATPSIVPSWINDWRSANGFAPDYGTQVAFSGTPRAHIDSLSIELIGGAVSTTTNSLVYNHATAVALASSQAVPAINPIDAGLGWYFTNVNGAAPDNKISWYFISSPGYTYADIGFISFVAKLYNASHIQSFPFLSIYTVGTANGWYESRHTFMFNSTNIASISDNDTVSAYMGADPEESEVHHNVFLEKDATFSLGPQLDSENIFLVALSTDSSAPTGHVSFALTKFKYRLGNDIQVINTTGV